MPDPVIIDDASDDRVVFIGDRWMRDVSFIISKERFQRLWSGHECLNCQEPLPDSFPEECPLIGCGYRVRECQRRDLEWDYAGENEEWNRLMRDEETVEERATRSGIWVPG